MIRSASVWQRPLLKALVRRACPVRRTAVCPAIGCRVQVVGILRRSYGPQKEHAQHKEAFQRTAVFVAPLPSKPKAPNPKSI